MIEHKFTYSYAEAIIVTMDGGKELVFERKSVKRDSQLSTLFQDDVRFSGKDKT